MFALLAATAVKPTVWEKLQAVPTETWISLLFAVGVIFLIVKIWKSLAEVNEIIPWIALVTVGGAVILYWTYERAEPRLLKPVFDVLADFLPTRSPKTDGL